MRGIGIHPKKQIRMLEYGQKIRIPKREWRSFLPVVDSFRQILLDRPEIERTPLDWIRFWVNGPLDDDFTGVKDGPYIVDECPMSGDLIVTLPIHCCPRCHGSGKYALLPKYNFGDDVKEFVQIEYIECDHKNMATSAKW